MCKRVQLLCVSKFENYKSIKSQLPKVWVISAIKGCFVKGIYIRKVLCGCYWFASLVERGEVVSCVWSTACFTVLINQSFVLFFHKYFFNITTTAILQLMILQNSCFAKHLLLTEFDLYDSHLDNSGLEYTFWWRNIFCANEEAFLHLLHFFLSLSKAGQALFDGYELLSAH